MNQTAKPNMFTYEAIVACLGEDACKYAKNKQRGGASGKKGVRYEDFFLAAKAGEVAASYFNSAITTWPFLKGQTEGFVDDAVIASETETQYFQLKNVASLSWKSGDHPLETDFSYQYELATHRGDPNPTTFLVVPDAQIKTAMSETIPKTIKSHSDVLFFPYCDGKFNRLVIENVEIQNALRQLAKVENPKLDELVAVFGVLLLACINHPEGCSVDQLIKFANNLQPSQIRTLDDGALPLLEEFASVLAGISGLTYDIKKGFFSWSGFGTSGVFGFDCSSAEFKQFQDVVIQKQPKTFDDFELLIP